MPPYVIGAGGRRIPAANLAEIDEQLSELSVRLRSREARFGSEVRRRLHTDIDVLLARRMRLQLQYT